MPARIDRLTISRGPAIVKFGGGVFYSKSDIVLDWGLTDEGVESDAYGEIFKYRLDARPTLKVPLVGEIEHLAVLFPYAGLAVGKSIFGDADAPLEICPIDTTQQKTIFAAAAVSVMPELTLGIDGGGPALGEATFAFVRANGSLPTDDDCWYTKAANDWDGTGLNPSLIKVQSYDCRWMSNGTFTLTFGANTTAAIDWDDDDTAVAAALNALASIVTAEGVTVDGDVDEGWTITFDENGDRGAITGAVTGMPGGTSVKVTVVQQGTAELPEIVRIELFPWHRFSPRQAIKVGWDLSIEPDTADSVGVYDMIFTGVTARASMIPQNVSESVLEAAVPVQGASFVRGGNMATDGHTLRMYAAGLFVELRGANIRKTGKVWSRSNQRVPELEWVASRTISDGTPDDLFYVGTVAPE